MKTAERIKKLGFKRWYERQLIEAHVYLVTCLLGIVLTLSAVEMIRGTAGVAPEVLRIVVAGAGALLTAYGLHRYCTMMIFAHRLTDKAVCPRCGEYARFSVTSFGPKTLETEEQTAEFWLKVKCRECGTSWNL